MHTVLFDRVSDESGTVKMKEVGSSPLSQSLLDSNVRILFILFIFLSILFTLHALYIKIYMLVIYIRM